MAIIIGTNGNDTLQGFSEQDFFDTITTVTGGGGKDIFVYRNDVGSYTSVITDFGGVGEGKNPTAAVIAEVDTLNFQNNNDFTAQNLILTQNGNNLEINFQGFIFRTIILENFALENLENLTKSTGATVDLGNILFYGQTTITDSFDVFNANSTQSTVFKKNTVTFLNDLSNNVSGFDNSNDVINGQGGNDIIEGLSGNDILKGGAGNNTLNGGVGDDFLDADSPSGNNLLNGGDGNDSLTASGSDEYNAYYGEVDDRSFGNNTLNGGAGDDTLNASGSFGDNLLDGGDGNDSLSISGSVSSEQYTSSNSRSDGDNTLNGDAGNDTLNASGSSGDNLLFGGDGNDFLSISGFLYQYYDSGYDSRSSGNNLLSGGDGNDTLTASGATGNNTLNGGNGDDSLTGGDGKDSLTGGGGKDKFVYKGLSNDRINTGTHTIADFTGVGKGTNPTAAVIAEVDTLIFQDSRAFTADNLLLTQNGTSLEISFQGYDNTRFILENFALENLENLTKSTGATVDLGNILFYGQTTLTDSFDVFDANSTQSTVFKKNTVTFLNDLSNNVTGFDNSNDVINGQGGDDIIEGLSGNDILRGGDGNNILNGGDGNDTLNGGTGNNTLNGGNGDDSLNFYSLSTLVTQTVDGGTGNDTLSFSYSSATTGITSTFNPTTNIAIISTTADTKVFNYKNIEQLNITGTDYDDYLVGSNGNDTLRSGNGNDTIDGGAGEDFLDISLSTGDHLLNGGNGNDSLQALSYIYDEYGNFVENGVSGDNTLNGGAGNDTLNVYGSADDNLLDGGDGNDFLSATNTSGENILNGGVGNDTLNIGTFTGNNLLNGGDGNDFLIASSASNNNTLKGGNGDDTLIGGYGNDSLYGEGGTDTFVFDTFFNEGLNLIRDFDATNELIQVGAASFSGGLSAGVLKTSQFTLGESATTSTQRFIYNSTTGALFFDLDGSAGAFTQVQFAGLSPGLSLINNNFVVV
ncbi:beta strand repeat-containing protein [Nostoc sp.]